ncbi:MBL fold metallo-hydrolase [Beduinella massiliensis]|uniref:MBL fold metallo-hydrolase n=1 Tax=Beduinella massiliensis TaxID=1852363 RepID=UPI000C866D7D
MKISRVVSDKLQSNMYLIKENGHAVVIDPCSDTSAGEGLKIDRILITHEHYDHISGVNAWKEAYHAPLLCSRTCAEIIRDSRKNMARYFDALCEIQSWIALDHIPLSDPAYKAEADEIFEQYYSFEWQGHIFKLYELPGHSKGGMGIFLDDTIYFSGDNLIPGMEVELRFPGGNRAEWASITKPFLDALPSSITVYPGHHHHFIMEEKKNDRTRKTGSSGRNSGG